MTVSFATHADVPQHIIDQFPSEEFFMDIGSLQLMIVTFTLGTGEKHLRLRGLPERYRDACANDLMPMPGQYPEIFMWGPWDRRKPEERTRQLFVKSRVRDALLITRNHIEQFVRDDATPVTP